MVLVKLKKIARAYLGDKPPVKQAFTIVLTYFNESRRQAMQDAGTVVGLEVLWSSMSQQQLPWLGQEGQNVGECHVLIVDVGGGAV